MAIKFVIDSASDILPEEAARLDLVHIPMLVSFDGQEYKDGVDLTHREFYEKLIESDALPTTSQVTPACFEAACRKIVDAGDTPVIITLSSKLSGTYQSAVLAAQEFEGKAYVVDSENVCIGERLLILRAVELRNQGYSAGQIVERLEEEKKHIRVLAILDTLEYLKKGGRISSAVAFAGNLLSIKPVIAVENGEIALVGKARGSKKGNNLLRQMVEICGGINFEKPYCLAYSGLSDEMLQKYIADSADLWQGKVESLPIATVGSTIGTHVGPGAIAVSFFAL